MAKKHIITHMTHQIMDKYSISNKMARDIATYVMQHAGHNMFGRLPVACGCGGAVVDVNCMTVNAIDAQHSTSEK